MVNYLRPTSLQEALEFRAETGALPFAGGTDLMVRFRGYSGTGTAIEGPVLFLDAVRELRGISRQGDRLLIGAGASLTEIIEHAATPELLQRAVELIAAPGLRNRATLAGNICNASPAGDSIPPLYVHNAELRLAGSGGERLVPADKFFTGPGATVLKADELLVAVEIPLLPEGTIYYRKVGTRRANALSKLSAAGYARMEKGSVVDFRFALGAVAPTVIRIRDAEALLTGAARGELKSAAVLEAAEKYIRPIDDQRSTAAYRTRTALNALQEFLTQIAD